MTTLPPPPPPGSEPGGFIYGPEIWMFGLGVIATAVVFSVFIWLIRLMIREDREVRLRESLENRVQGTKKEEIEQ